MNHPLIYSINDITSQGQLQLFEPTFSVEVKIDSNSPALLISELCKEDIVFNNLSQVQYSKKGRKLSVDVDKMIKIILLSAYKSELEIRKIERNCKENIEFRYILQGQNPPSKSKIAKFMIDYQKDIEDIIEQFNKFLLNKNKIRLDEVFIDGTKIQANSNIYKFSWKKATERFSIKNRIKILNIVIDFCNLVGRSTLDIYNRNELIEEILSYSSSFVYRKYKRLEPLERIIRNLIKCLEKEKEYQEKFKLYGNRNSYSKTDIDATFMRSKKDYMRNDRLIPAYNIQIAVNNGYVLGVELFQNPTDTKTLIPFLNKLKEKGYIFKDIVADAGYDGEDNFKYLKEMGYNNYIKPSSYEKDKRRVVRNDLDNIYNLDIKENELIRKDGMRYLKVGQYTYRGKLISIFEYKGIRKTISIEYQLLKKEAYQNITSEYGAKLRMNRSIQVEGAFANIKGNFKFDRFRRRGINKCRFEFSLYALGHNLRRYINSIRKGKKEIFLHELKVS